MKAKSLFKYLMAQRRRCIPKDELMEVLWPECDPGAASNNLKTAAYSLRQSLAFCEREANGDPSSSCIVFMEGTYAINPRLELWIDVDEFERLWMSGQRLEREGKADQAARAYETAVGLYRGDYFQDDPYEEWTLLRREALKDTYLHMLGKLADWSMEAGDYQRCIVYSHAILVSDPCREDAYRNLMCSHSRLGQRSRALYWYNGCVRSLESTLDVTPEESTKVLYERLLAGKLL